MFEEKIRQPKPKRDEYGWSRVTIIRDLGNDIIEKTTRGITSNKKRYNLEDKFGRVIKRLRKIHKKKQTDLAKECNINRSHLSRIENGKDNLSLKVIKSISNAFKIYTYELLELNPKNIIKRDSIEQEDNLEIQLGIRIKELRKINNMKQIDLAKKSHLQRSYISMVENGKINISLWNIGKIAKAFNLYIHLLMKFN